jgi:hypothetical protein
MNLPLPPLLPVTRQGETFDSVEQIDPEIRRAGAEIQPRPAAIATAPIAPPCVQTSRCSIQAHGSHPDRERGSRQRGDRNDSRQFACPRTKRTAN